MSESGRMRDNYGIVTRDSRDRDKLVYPVGMVLLVDQFNQTNHTDQMKLPAAAYSAESAASAARAGSYGVFGKGE
jgi:hypothetical protein